MEIAKGEARNVCEPEELAKTSSFDFPPIQFLLGSVLLDSADSARFPSSSPDNFNSTTFPTPATTREWLGNQYAIHSWTVTDCYRSVDRRRVRHARSKYEPIAWSRLRVKRLCRPQFRRNAPSTRRVSTIAATILSCRCRIDGGLCGHVRVSRLRGDAA